MEERAFCGLTDRLPPPMKLISMDSLLACFGAAYLINLPERKDRLRSATKELERVGWTLGPGAVQIYEAQKFTDCAGFPGNPSVRGCFHSHSECIRTAHLLGKKSVLLIEDDIALTSSIRRLTPSIISQLESTPWDFFYLGHEHTGEIGYANSRTTEIKLVPVTTEIRTTHFFAINGRIFARLLEHLDRIAAGIDQEFGRMPVDGAYNVFRRKYSDVRALIATPKLGWQRPSRSDITSRRFDHIQSLQPLVNVLRNLKYIASRWGS
jgi:GR25 family glycosyltransferase involved in LPS biosynthesis